MALLVCLALTRFAGAQEKVPVRLNLAPGTNWKFGQTEIMDLDSTLTAGGQQQQMKQRGNRKISGKAEVLESNAGAPTAIRFTFDQDCGGVMDQGMGQQMPLPFSLAGQTVTVRLANGQLTHDFRGQIDPQTLSDLDSLAQQEQRYLPTKPVGVGDTWSPDVAGLAKAWQLDPSRNKIGVGMEVKEFVEVKGRKAMIVLMTADIAGEVAPGLTGGRKLQGPVLIDIASGRILSADLNGTVEMSGAQDGQGMQMSMQSRGSVSIKIESSVPQGGAPGPIGGNPPAGDGGNPIGGAAVASNFAGTYDDGQIKLVLQPATADGYSGAIFMGQQNFRVSAVSQNGRLVGTFESGGQKFEFTGDPDGAGGLKLTTGNTTYALKRVGDGNKNPLAR
jgi:hypothetical protein